MTQGAAGSSAVHDGKKSSLFFSLLTAVNSTNTFLTVVYHSSTCHIESKPVERRYALGSAFTLRVMSAASSQEAILARKFGATPRNLSVKG
ncbi:hypothetical protein Q7C36_000499 [Tachysurus vachellii]|uniref:Uncharacterized protein n=1 Tax=Tachysurus vachellii TaxID=175792 RepID=A0AA88NW51_TACVA|nr:hypothetical protein Q7C36_000499 [Tachysurus vachellii]